MTSAASAGAGAATLTATVQTHEELLQDVRVIMRAILHQQISYSWKLARLGSNRLHLSITLRKIESK